MTIQHGSSETKSIQSSQNRLVAHKQNHIKNNSKLVIQIDNSTNNGVNDAYREIISPLSNIGYLQTQSSKASTTRNNRSRKLAFSRGNNNNNKIISQIESRKNSTLTIDRDQITGCSSTNKNNISLSSQNNTIQNHLNYIAGGGGAGVSNNVPFNGNPNTSLPHYTNTNNTNNNSFNQFITNNSLYKETINSEKSNPQIGQVSHQTLEPPHPNTSTHQIDSNYSPFSSISKVKEKRTNSIDVSITSIKEISNAGGATPSQNNYMSNTATGFGLSIQKEEQLDWSKVKLPIEPDEIVKKYGNLLSDYQKTEITQYMKVYFIGHEAQQINKSKEPNAINFGYDDDKGDYHFSTQDHIGYRYEIIETLGKGSFGQVYKVFDHQRKEHVALKMIRNKKQFYNQAIVELKILKFLKDNDPYNQTNIVKIKDFIIFRNHVCFVFEELSINLYQFLKNNKFAGISLQLIRRFAIQILQGLLYLEKANIIHCDLKPENILLKQPNQSGIKIVDFGSSCFDTEQIYTYIQSRFYRAPEIILGYPYSFPIDMWSFGCIMAQLYMGFPIFPGENQKEQLSMFMELMGLPDDEILAQCTRQKLFFDSQSNAPILEPNSQGKKRFPGTKDLNYFLRCPDKCFIDFVSRCFCWNPEKRMKPSEGLVHEWILDGLPEEIRNQHLIQMQRNDLKNKENSKQQLAEQQHIKHNNYNQNAPQPYQQIQNKTPLNNQEAGEIINRGAEFGLKKLSVQERNQFQNNTAILNSTPISQEQKLLKNGKGIENYTPNPDQKGSSNQNYNINQSNLSSINVSPRSPQTQISYKPKEYDPKSPFQNIINNNQSNNPQLQVPQQPGLMHHKFNHAELSHISDYNPYESEMKIPESCPVQKHNQAKNEFIENIVPSTSTNNKAVGAGKNNLLHLKIKEYNSNSRNSQSKNSKNIPILGGDENSTIQY